MTDAKPSELQGLAALFLTTGTLHTIEEPPENATPEEYDAWWLRTHCWRSELRPA